MGLKNLIKNIFKVKKNLYEKKGQLFFIGNKRSGTTILAEKISIHPDIYITHETDIIWILYNLYNDIEFEYYAMDEPHSTVVTREMCKAILDDYKKMTPLECYEKCQYFLMENGTQWRKPTSRVPILLGDKKPNQQSEVLVNDWVHKHFPNTKYIHIVRHPYDFLKSIPRLLPKYDLGARYGSSKCEDPTIIIETWARFESLVIDEKKRNRFPIYSVRFEDFCNHPAKSLAEIWQFSGLSIPVELQEKIDSNDNFGILAKGLHANSRGNEYHHKVPDNIKDVMAVYNYEV